MAVAASTRHAARPVRTIALTRVWVPVQMLVAGALLAPAWRTVAAALRAMGLGPGDAVPSLPLGAPGSHHARLVSHIFNSSLSVSIEFERRRIKISL